MTSNEKNNDTFFQLLRPKGTTTLESFSKECKAKQFYDKLKNDIPKGVSKELAAIAIAEGVYVVMDHHYYEVGGGGSLNREMGVQWA